MKPIRNTPRNVTAIGKTGKAIVTSSAQHMRQMRCMRCNQMATPTTLPDGSPVCRCNTCGTVYKVTKM